VVVWGTNIYFSLSVKYKEKKLLIYLSEPKSINLNFWVRWCTRAFNELSLSLSLSLFIYIYI
jgi:hypothetical protein